MSVPNLNCPNCKVATKEFFRACNQCGEVLAELDRCGQCRNFLGADWPSCYWCRFEAEETGGEQRNERIGKYRSITPIQHHRLEELVREIDRIRVSQAKSRKALDGLTIEFKSLLADFEGYEWQIGGFYVKQIPTGRANTTKFIEEMERRGINRNLIDECLEATKTRSFRYSTDSVQQAPFD